MVLGAQAQSGLPLVAFADDVDVFLVREPVLANLDDEPQLELLVLLPLRYVDLATKLPGELAVAADALLSEEDLER